MPTLQAVPYSPEVRKDTDNTFQYKHIHLLKTEGVGDCKSGMAIDNKCIDFHSSQSLGGNHITFVLLNGTGLTLLHTLKL